MAWGHRIHWRRETCGKKLAVRSRSQQRATLRHTSRQLRAAVTPSAVLLRGALSLRSAHRLRASAPPQTSPCGKSATPPGTACARRIAHERGAPARPAPARHAARPLRSRSASRARPDQPGGDPAAPIGCRHASTAARTNAAGRRVAAAKAAGLGSRSFVALELTEGS